MTQIGLFGLGLIGQALTRRLIAGGYRVVGFDPNPAAVLAFEDLGGTGATSAEVWQAPVILTAVFDTAQLSTVIASAPNGTGAVLISTSTCDPEAMPDLFHLAKAKQIDLIEAPLSGTSKDLANGNAVFLLGGEAAVCDAQSGLFDVLGRAHHYLGEIGQGNRAKLAVNLVLGLNRAALAEGLVFAKGLGLDPAAFLSLLQVTAASSAVMAGKGPLMVNRDFSPLGRIAQSAKDFTLIREAGANAGQALPFTRTYLQMMQDCLDRGEGDLDNSAILLAIERAAPSGQDT